MSMRIEPINRLLGQHIADWVEHNRPKLAVTTYNQYVNILNLHLIPYFNPRGITLGNVTPGDLATRPAKAKRIPNTPYSVEEVARLRYHHALPGVYDEICRNVLHRRYAGYILITRNPVLEGSLCKKSKNSPCPAVRPGW